MENFYKSQRLFDYGELPLGHQLLETQTQGGETSIMMMKMKMMKVMMKITTVSWTLQPTGLAICWPATPLFATAN